MTILVTTIHIRKQEVNVLTPNRSEKGWHNYVTIHLLRTFQSIPGISMGVQYVRGKGIQQYGFWLVENTGMSLAFNDWQWIIWYNITLAGQKYRYILFFSVNQQLSLDHLIQPVGFSMVKNPCSPILQANGHQSMCKWLCYLLCAPDTISLKKGVRLTVT